MLNLSEREEKVVEHWKRIGVNNLVREKNAGRKKYYFLDGPPYVTGDLHPGHIWVKTLKDIFVRYKRYRGFDVIDRAGYDVHGLPIENKVEKELHISSKKEIEERIGIDDFVKKCREYVDKYIGRIDADYERYGVSLDFKNPYLPYTNEYIETAWSMFKTASENRYLYEGKKTLIYCPHCETPLSQGSMEVEYKDVDDPSLFLAFKIDEKRSKPKIELGNGLYLAVWTTTPWTIPGNVAIAANPKERYVIARLGDKRLVIAKERLDTLSAVLNESAIIESEFYGSDLDGIYYTSPLESKMDMQKSLRRYHKIILSDSLVTMTEGTGLVHIAPGSGIEDYMLAQKAKLPIFSPVGSDAVYTSEGGGYAGLKVPSDANKTVLNDLAEAGALLHKSSIRHSYPHCWRCGNKLIFLATKQWFMNVQKMKNRLIRHNLKTSWYPDEAQKWEEDILTNSPDWCISRQRYWGIPMPIWICEKCNSKSVIGSRSELESRATNPEFVRFMADLHRPEIDKAHVKCDCGGSMTRVPDVFDVWWDSSVAFRAGISEEQFGKFLPTELVLEYVEQIRGWFQGMLKASVMVYGKNPMRNIVVHGILFGKDGKKLSKSLGNYEPLGEMLKFATADAFRLWATLTNPILNRTLNEQAMQAIKDAEKVVNILHNASKLLWEYEELLKYVPKVKKIPAKGLESIDAWMASRLESVTEAVTRHLDNYEPYKAAAVLKDFVVEDFSRFYIKMAKKRILYSDKRTAKKIIDIINGALYRTIILISPITPFVSESVYLERYKNKESIFLESWQKPNMKTINAPLENEMDVVKEAITAVLSSRERAGISLRWPISKATLEVKDDTSRNAIERLSSIIADYVNAKQIDVKTGGGANEKIVPLFGKLGPSFKNRANDVANALKSADANTLRSAIERSGHYTLHTASGNVEISNEHFTITQSGEDADSVGFRYGRASIDKTLNKALKDEALLREFERRIQLIRKEMGLNKSNKIELGYEVVGELAVLLKENSASVKKAVNASRLENHPIKEAAQKEFEIEGETIRITVRKE